MWRLLFSDEEILLKLSSVITWEGDPVSAELEAVGGRVLENRTSIVYIGHHWLQSAHAIKKRKKEKRKACSRKN